MGRVGILTNGHSKLAWGLDLLLSLASGCAKVQSWVFFHDHNLDWWNDQVHWKYPLAGDGMHDKLWGPISLEPGTFWQRNFTGFLTPCCWQTYLKVRTIWDGHTKDFIKLPDSYKIKQNFFSLLLPVYIVLQQSQFWM